MTEYNGVMMQFFHWYTPADGKLWSNLSQQAGELARAGITAVWLPPAYKGIAGKSDVGYGVYDLFDLGEFDQKGSVRTKYGTKDEYVKAIMDAQKAGIHVYADIVFNHKLGADHQEEFKATPYKPDNRHEPLGELQPIKAWTHFSFPGRKGKYSELKWHWWHFNAADYNAFDKHQDAIWLFEGKTFDDSVDLEKGNFDYLMGCNLDINNPDVKKELFYWGDWYLKTTGVDGFRFDAVKHVNSSFFLEWLKHIKKNAGKKLFALGEYWSGESEALHNFLDETDGAMMLFDVTLHYNFAAAGKQGRDYDLTKIFENTLVASHPMLAVTLVSNHDSQPLQSLESVVEAWFKPLAYALILLRKDGYPCIFSADYYGAHYKDKGRDGNEHEIWMDSHRWLIDKFLEVRKEHAYGEQYDYFDHPNCVGWTRTGNGDSGRGMAVIMSNGDDGEKKMQTEHPNTTYTDITEHIKNPVTTDGEGWGNFFCKAGSVSVWIPAKT
ncbi:alpha-amylase [Alkalitalea saponilacus]|uniref:Alpha-amylase n=1 Tax=Alkalitalea saponilacus TaxID=889453 RepID=A0A1T5FVC9_9BACT|nr:alpha-amylase [Alkalitalea saponilacus]ASB49504.1 alpha-amylase [Alkalitalea saponilacus]SKC00047.1 alpha-amylase [Alkalitalea saponilacus]